MGGSDNKTETYRFYGQNIVKYFPKGHTVAFFWDCIFKSSSSLEHALLHALLVFRAFCTRTSTGPSQISEPGAPNLIQRYTPLSWCYVRSYRHHRVRKQVNIRVQNFCIFEFDSFCSLKMALGCLQRESYFCTFIKNSLNFGIFIQIIHQKILLLPYFIVYFPTLFLLFLKL